jgi:hypothetical protein
MNIILIYILISGELIVMFSCLLCIYKYKSKYNIMHRSNRIHNNHRVHNNHRLPLHGNSTIPISIIPNEPVVINVSPTSNTNDIVSTPVAVSVSNTASLQNIPIAPHINPTIATLV